MTWASTSLDTPGSSPDPLPRTADGAHAVCVSRALSYTGHLASLVHPPDAYALILQIVGVQERWGGHGFVFTWEACAFISCMGSHLGTADKEPTLPEHIQGQDNVWEEREEWSEIKYTKEAEKGSCETGLRSQGCQRARPTCVTVEDLTGQSLQLKHFQARAVRSHNNVGVIGPKEPNIQHLLAIASKLWEAGRS